MHYDAVFLSDHIILPIYLIRDLGPRGFTQVANCIPELIFYSLVIRLFTKLYEHSILTPNIIICDYGGASLAWISFPCLLNITKVLIYLL
jgi:hypothetical protein